MDKTIWIPSLIIWGIAVVAYLIGCAVRRKEPDIGFVINSIPTAGGIAAGGFLLLATTVKPELKLKLSELNSYIFISGVALVGVSLKSIVTDFMKLLGLKFPEKKQLDEALSAPLPASAQLVRPTAQPAKKKKPRRR